MNGLSVRRAGNVLLAVSAIGTASVLLAGCTDPQKAASVQSGLMTAQIVCAATSAAAPALLAPVDPSGKPIDPTGKTQAYIDKVCQLLGAVSATQAQITAAQQAATPVATSVVTPPATSQ